MMLGKKKQENLLINETSPYLLQHAHNPVHWHGWNDETLQKARDEDKMLLISIGYAACHWCHVMERESFNDEEVARIMNEHFICIKVDREERPDVDHIYMNAAFLINGSGGWPLNALALPDGRPFYAGTYFPRDNWIKLLNYYQNLFETERERLVEQAAQMTQGIVSIETVPDLKDVSSFRKKDVDKMVSVLSKKLDARNGGLAGSIKFPMPSIWNFLLQYSYHCDNESCSQVVENTLVNMSEGGIYDHIGGGFSRYSTDAQWHVPHFEKMLYDNAQLISLYSEAYKKAPDYRYARVVKESIYFVLRELTSPEGGFFSALDADSEGVEGKYYIWSEKEIKQILQEDAQIYLDYYGFSPTGNWENMKNIPDRRMGDHEMARELNMFQEDLFAKIDALNQKLFVEREKRVRPAVDDKILTSWNALMIAGLCDAYQAFGEELYFRETQAHLDFLLKNLCKDQLLFRNFKNGKASIPAFLDDYAFLIRALIKFYQISFDEKYLYKAKEFAVYVLEHFLNEQRNMFYYTHNEHDKLIVRKTEITDNVIPASNSEMAKNLFYLGHYFENREFLSLSETMVFTVLPDVLKSPSYHSNWAEAYLMHTHEVVQIAITGPEWKQRLSTIQKQYHPHILFMGGVEGTLPLLEGKFSDNKTLIFVCRNKTCEAPIEFWEEEIQDIHE